MKKSGIIVFLILILATASYLRFRDLGSNPPAVFRDEAEKGYSAWSLAKTGGYLYFEGQGGMMELRFQKFPLFINVFGVYTSAIYQYSAIPFVGLFGLNEWTLRLPAALAGVLTVFLVFLLVFIRGKDPFPALFVSFFLAVSPWHILFSRWALQGIFVPLLITSALILFFLGLEKKSWLLIPSAFFFALAFYSYEVARLFAPLLLIPLVVIYRHPLWEKRKWTIPAMSLFLFISIPIFLYYITGDRAARFSRLSIFNQGHGILHIIFIFLSNYLKHYSPNFLFLYGDGELRHSFPGMGMMYLFEAPLLLYGLWLLVQKRAPFHLFLVAWFFIFPIPASLTGEGIPHGLRSIVALPMPQIICGIAVAALYRKMFDFSRGAPFRKRIMTIVLMFLISLIMLINVFQMAKNLFYKYPADSWLNWQYGLKQALEYAHKENIKPEKVFLSGYIAYAPYLVMFYDRISPETLRDKGAQGLGYQFLPPQYPMQNLWKKLPEGSVLILFPGELIGIKPSHTIYPPSYKKDVPRQPALIVYKKYGGKYGEYGGQTLPW